MTNRPTLSPCSIEFKHCPTSSSRFETTIVLTFPSTRQAKASSASCSVPKDEPIRRTPFPTKYSGPTRNLVLVGAWRAKVRQGDLTEGWLLTQSDAAQYSGLAHVKGGLLICLGARTHDYDSVGATSCRLVGVSRQVLIARESVNSPGRLCCGRICNTVLVIIPINNYRCFGEIDEAVGSQLLAQRLLFVTAINGQDT